jgi:hypothetical protein
VTGFSRPDGQSRSQTGAPPCWQFVRILKYPGYRVDPKCELMVINLANPRHPPVYWTRTVAEWTPRK